jgi:hypothetical protein
MCSAHSTGGIATGGAATIQLDNSLLEFNRAKRDGGGQDGRFYSVMKFTDCVVQYNKAGELGKWWSPPSLLPERTINLLAYFTILPPPPLYHFIGGGIHGFTPDTTVDVRSSLVRWNVAGAMGGGLYVCGYGYMDVVDSEVVENVASGSGECKIK